MVYEINMKLENIVQKTGVVNGDMTIEEGFKECVKNNVPGIPYVDPEGHITGNFTIRDALLSTCIPHIMVEYADLLGDDPGCLKIPEQHAHTVLSLPAASFVNKQLVTIGPDTAISKVIALMEKHKTNYLFVVDAGDYVGIVTIDGIASRMLEIGRQQPEQVES
jgi:CBS domain-containing protein